MANKSFEKSEYWSAAWTRHIETYLSAPPRCGIWLSHYLRDNTLSFLECAGGSCRDSRYLFDKGYSSTGSDFDDKTLDYVRNRFSKSKFPLRKENAFSLSFGDDEIDVVFNNGFLVCFNNDEEIALLLDEQARVSKKYMIALVHNMRNKNLVAKFKELSTNDDLYSIRFFDIKALEKVLKLSRIKFKQVKYEKFGGPIDILFAVERKIPFLSPLIRWTVPRLYRYQPWSRVERIAMVVELDKQQQ